MPTPPQIVDSLCERFGEVALIHTAIPPFHLGGEQVDVAEFVRDDGSILYITAGVTSAGDVMSQELMLHASGRHPSLINLMSKLGGSTRHRRYQHGGTIALADSDGRPPFAGLGFLFSGQRIPVEGVGYRLLQVVGLTAEELAAARTESLYTVEAALWRDGRGLMSEPGRPTTPSLAEMIPVRPPPEALTGLSAEAQDVVECVVNADHEEAELRRGTFSEDEARTLATALGSLPHPTQLAALLHALMDFAVPELERPARRMLSIPPEHPMAQQYYADALAMLEAINGGDHFETYDRYYGDFEAAKARAAQLRI